MWVRAGSQPEPGTNSSPRNTQSVLAQSGGVGVRKNKAVLMVICAVKCKFQTPAAIFKNHPSAPTAPPICTDIDRPARFSRYQGEVKIER